MLVNCYKTLSKHAISKPNKLTTTLLELSLATPIIGPRADEFIFKQ